MDSGPEGTSLEPKTGVEVSKKRIELMRQIIAINNSILDVLRRWVDDIRARTRGLDEEENQLVDREVTGDHQTDPEPEM